jgi:hypothetical protein
LTFDERLALRQVIDERRRLQLVAEEERGSGRPKHGTRKWESILRAERRRAQGVDGAVRA